MADALTCPKCGGDMRSYERNGITIDQCNECRGIFLDRGELERLMDAEAGYMAERQQQAPPPQAAPQQAAAPRRDYDDRRHSGDYYPKRKKSFLSEIFD